MGRLSTIEDVERRAQQADEAPAEAAQPAAQAAAQEAPAAPEPTPEPAPAPQAAAQPAAEQPTRPARKSQAQIEMDFHGLDEKPPKGNGHGALVVLAVIVVVAIVVYVANYQLHFF